VNPKQRNLKMTATELWGIVRPALKQHGGSLHAKDGRYWLLVPIDPEFFPHIASHPAIVVDEQHGSATHQCFRWRQGNAALGRRGNGGAL
jgi:hypothetical protein